jgi:hypothetical protein
MPGGGAGAIDQFGIDVLVNNAASFYAGYFQELSPEQMDPAVGDEPPWPDERHARRRAGDAQAAISGRIDLDLSSAGLVAEFCTAYAA